MKARLFAVVVVALAFPQAAFARGRVRSCQGVRAARVGFHPSRPAGPLDHQSCRLPDARDRRDDLPRALPDAGACAQRRGAGSSPDNRRADLRGRAGADRRARVAVEGDRALVSVRRLAVSLHLRRQPARVHTPAADGRDVPRRPGLGHLRGDELDLRHARTRAADVRVHPRRGDPLERAGPLLQELDPGGSEGACCSSSSRSRSWVSSCASSH